MQIKFLNINILHGGVFWDNLVSFIHEVKPDIMTLQEVYDGYDRSLEKHTRTMEEFKKEFSWLVYSEFGASTFDLGVNAPWGNAVFSKFPILASKNIFFDIPFGNFRFEKGEDSTKVPQAMFECEIDINGKMVSVFSWHGIWGEDGFDNPRRDEMAKIVVTNIKDKSSVILAGDSNLLPTTQVVRDIEKYLTNVFGDSLPSTFNMAHKDSPGYATASVDMVFASRDIKVLSKEMPIVNISDHYPLFVNLEI